MAENLYTTVVVNDEEYRIKKFTAITGLQIARLVMSKFAPIIPLIGSSKDTGMDEMLTIVGGAIEAVTDEDVEHLVKKSLRVCAKKLASGWVNCIDVNGNYAVEGLEYDPATTILLIIEAIKWGAADFFTGKASGLLQKLNLGSNLSAE